VDGRVLETEALAGSAAPGQAEGLGGRDKDRREHDSVVRYILSALRPIAERVTADSEPALLQLKNVVHLRTGIRAELRNGVTPGQVVAALHPTPAVGGVPREHALGFLHEHEELDRGWYAGPVGWIGPTRAHMAVALRSALVRGDTARIFVGAGIVQGSCAEAEWRETEIKSLAMLRALGGGDVRRES
jgi:salicylate biosynthesis isochorismate synthase/menaquinone-specific isochorismate synthase